MSGASECLRDKASGTGSPRGSSRRHEANSQQHWQQRSAGPGASNTRHREVPLLFDVADWLELHASPRLRDESHGLLPGHCVKARGCLCLLHERRVRHRGDRLLDILNVLLS